ncbi:hypothetical protein BWQ96_05909 [Gracilariopsis chorda]|uniref:Uncharacterized protein n=1 Tax=Gracilariopsis chorda TaxID=448386 RepID=A0A2V3IQG3_9FLOR|nr:hypothetical protein BWQ96_05909 [Gracilariopsis chorda]|eukprot:PXF44345.1 hypothetical protein BWQ96_05909 [Gracilariopsis chorda]
MFIPIRAQIVSLVVTLVFVATELCVLWVAKTITVLFETQKLCRKVTIGLYQHCLRRRVTAAVVLLSFLALETLTSTLTQTSFRDEKVQRDCLKLVPITQTSDPNVFHDQRSESILYRCLNFNRDIFEQRLGGVSLEPSDVTCEDQPYYSYNNSQRVRRSTSSATMTCKNISSLNLERETVVHEWCVFHEVERDTLYMSAQPFPESEAEEEGSFIVTKVHTDITPFVPKVVDRYLHFFVKDSETEELHLRGVMFTDLVETQCSFSSGKTEGVTVPDFILVTVAALWLLAILGAIFTKLLTRKKTLIYLSDPFFWANISLEKVTIPKKNIRVDENGDILRDEGEFTWQKSASSLGQPSV